MVKLKLEESKRLYERAKRVTVGAVRSIDRMHHAQGGLPTNLARLPKRRILYSYLTRSSRLQDGKIHQHLFCLGDIMRKGVSDIIEELNLKGQVWGFRSIFNVYFTDEKIVNYRSLLSNDSELFMKYNNEMRERGFLFIAHPLKRCHLSAAHTEEDVRRFIEATQDVLSGFTKR